MHNTKASIFSPEREERVVKAIEKLVDHICAIDLPMETQAPSHPPPSWNKRRIEYLERELKKTEAKLNLDNPR